MLERDIESWSKKYATKRKFYVRKYKTPSRRSAPDDIFIKHGRVFFVEFKATGEAPTEKQEEEHRILRAAGATVYWTDSRERFKEILDGENEVIKWMD